MSSPSVFERWHDEQDAASRSEEDEALWRLRLAEARPPKGEVQARPLAGVDLRRLDQPLPPPRWLVEGRMTRETLTVLGAKPGVGKSWIALDLSLAVATGRPFLGSPVRSPGRVLYLDAENGEHLALRRLRQLGARPEDLGGRLRYSTEPLVLVRTLDVRRLLLTLEEHRPDLVVVDTLASHAPSAESDTESMAGFLAQVWSASRASGAAMLLLHHLRKSLQSAGRDDPLDSFRGAGHLIGAADRAWISTRSRPASRGSSCATSSPASSPAPTRRASPWSTPGTAPPATARPVSRCRASSVSSSAATTPTWPPC